MKKENLLKMKLLLLLANNNLSEERILKANSVEDLQELFLRLRVPHTLKSLTSKINSGAICEETHFTRPIISEDSVRQALRGLREKGLISVRVDNSVKEVDYVFLSQAILFENEITEMMIE